MSAPHPILTPTSPPDLIRAGAGRGGFAAVRMLLGLLLLTTAGLKYADSSLEPLGHSAQVVSPHLHSAAIVTEAVMGLWLLYGRAARLLWLTAVAFFTGLASVSLYLGIAGVPSCGCFGEALTVSPWYTFGLDIVAAAALAMFRPRFGLHSGHTDGLAYAFGAADSSGPSIRFRFVRQAAFVLPFVVTALIFAYAYPYLSNQLLRQEGYSVAISEPVQHLNSCRVGEPVTAGFAVQNIGDTTVTIYGAETHCGCASVTNLPLEIPVGERRIVEFQVNPRSDLGRLFAQEARLFTDPASPPLVLRMVVRMAPDESPK